jgi:hypothetical protein
MNLQQYFGTLNSFNLKTFQLQVVDPIEGYNYDIKFVFIQARMKILWIIFKKKVSVSRQQKNKNK